jgi:radical SAM superfamily enzyme YgiQ (UPF0313 family)
MKKSRNIAKLELDMPNALLVYPEFPPSYWGYNYALEFIGKQSAMPPLGLITVAGLFPEKEWNLKLVDVNVEPLTDEALNWADYVFTSTMIVQKDSLYEVVRRCNQFDVPVIAGGPHPTSYQDEIKEECGGEVSYFLGGEVEHIFEPFLTDLLNGTAAEVYEGPRTKNKVQTDITKAPLPRFDLINLDAYGSMTVQFSRGCPFDCEFCDITKLFGRVPRTKTNEQFLAEFDLLYDLGWRGSVFVVDDNFIGNKRDTMRLLPAITEWQAEKDHPFVLYTETSANLVEIPGMLQGMADAGFIMTFIGIESPNDEALEKTVKMQNTSKEESARSYLLRAIQEIQGHGIEVTAGFIIGLDGDKEFQSHIDFIQEAGIPRAMAGLLTALKQTNLYNRLEQEGRMLHESTGNNVSVELNFVPELDRDYLLSEYKRVLRELYDPSLKNFFDRCLTMFDHLKPRQSHVTVSKAELKALLKSIRYQLLSRKQGPSYFRFLLQVLMRYPKRLPNAVRMAIMGYHYEKVTSQQVAIDDFKLYLSSELDKFKETAAQFAETQDDIDDIAVQPQSLFARVRKRYEEIHEDFRYGVQDALEGFEKSVFKQYLEAELDAFKKAMARFAKTQSDRVGEASTYVQSLLNRVQTQYEQIHHDFQGNLKDTLDSFRKSVKFQLEQLSGPTPQIQGLD